MSAERRWPRVRGEILRAVENVETACAMPILMQGTNCEDIAAGIDEHMIRQPLGVAAAIVPFNFPGMIAFWFFPYAVAAGNCFLLKPSERVPITSQKIFSLIQAAGFPPGVMQLVNGGRDTVNAILDHPGIRAVSFVGSTQTAKYIYSRAAAYGQARAVPGRREESGSGDAGRGHGNDDAHSRRFRVRMRGAALPGGIRGDYRGRRAAHLDGADCRGCEEPQDGLRRSPRRGDGPGDQRREQGAESRD